MPDILAAAMSRRRALAALVASSACAACNTMPGDQVTGVEVEPVRFTSRGVSLAGDMYLPLGAPLIAGVIIAHGSEPEKRSDQKARLLAADGFAVLTYDKRGVGESGGVYEGVYNISWNNLHLLADDLVAAVDCAAAHPRLRDSPIGVLGFSQAGWVAPIAAANSRRIGFLALWSGPVCAVSEELEADLSDRRKTGAPAGAPPEELVRQYIAQIRRDGTDVDSRDSLRGLTIPGLWIFGGQDHNNPVELSIRSLSALISEGKTNFAYRLFPDYGHSMVYPGASEEGYRLVVDWMRKSARAIRP